MVEEEDALEEVVVVSVCKSDEYNNNSFDARGVNLVFFFVLATWANVVFFEIITRICIGCE